LPRWLELEMEINESIQCISEFTVHKVLIWCVAYYTLTYISYDVTIVLDTLDRLLWMQLFHFFQSHILLSIIVREEWVEPGWVEPGQLRW